jgi:hypothetical protein
MWLKKNNYYIQNGEYTIAKTGIEEWTRYTLYHGTKRIETFLTANEAKEKHKELMNESNA